MAKRKLHEGDWNAIGNMFLLGSTIVGMIVIMLYAQMSHRSSPNHSDSAGEQLWILTSAELAHGCAGGRVHDVRTYTGSLPAIGNPAFACW
jgi:S1-C subfamily serine protease